MNRTSAWWFLIAFTVIGALTIIEGINDGFTFLNWVVIAVSVVFALQPCGPSHATGHLKPDSTNRVGRIGECSVTAGELGRALALIDRIRRIIYDQRLADDGARRQIRDELGVHDGIITD